MTRIISMQHVQNSAGREKITSATILAITTGTKYALQGGEELTVILVSTYFPAIISLFHLCGGFLICKWLLEIRSWLSFFPSKINYQKKSFLL